MQMIKKTFSAMSGGNCVKRGMAMLVAVALVLSTVIAMPFAWADAAEDQLLWVQEAENAGHTIGDIADYPEAGGGKAVRAMYGPNGYLFFGKVQDLEPGLYKATVSLNVLAGMDGGSAGSGDDWAKSIAIFDVVTNGGQKTEFAYSMSYAQTGMNEWKDIDFFLKVDQPISGAEFRFYKHGEPAAIALDKISLTKMEDAEQDIVIYPGMFPRNINDKRASVGNGNGLDTQPGMVNAENNGIILTNRFNSAANPYSEFNMRLSSGHYNINFFVGIMGNSVMVDGETDIASVTYHYIEDGVEKTTAPVTIKQKQVTAVASDAGPYCAVNIPITVPSGKTYNAFYPEVKYLLTDSSIGQTFRLNRYEISTATEIVYEAENANHTDGTCKVVDLADASGGKAVMVEKTSKGGHYIWGIQPILTAGYYKFTVRVKGISGVEFSSDNMKRPIGVFDIVTPAEGTTKTIYASSMHVNQFSPFDQWVNLDFYVRLAEDLTNPEIRMQGHGQGWMQFYVDNITMTKLNDDSVPMVINYGQYTTLSPLTAAGYSWNGLDIGGGAGGTGTLLTHDPAQSPEFNIPLPAGRYNIYHRVNYVNDTTVLPGDTEVFSVIYHYTVNGEEKTTDEQIISAAEISIPNRDPATGAWTAGDCETPENYASVNVPISIPENCTNFYAEVRTAGSITFRYRQMEIVKDNSGVAVYEAEDANHPNGTCTVVDLPGASGGKAVRVDKTSAGGHFIWGIQPVLTAGYYKFTVRVQAISGVDLTPDNFKRSIGVFDIVTPAEGTTKTIYASSMHLNQFNPFDQWINLDFYVRLAEDLTNPEIRMQGHGQGWMQFYVDNITMTKLYDDNTPMVINYGQYTTLSPLSAGYNWNGLDIGGGAGGTGTLLTHNPAQSSEFNIPLPAGSYDVYYRVNYAEDRTVLTSDKQVFSVVYHYTVNGIERTTDEQIVRAGAIEIPNRDPATGNWITGNCDSPENFASVNVPVTIPENCTNFYAEIRTAGNITFRFKQMEIVKGTASDIITFEAEDGQRNAGDAIVVDGASGSMAVQATYGTNGFLHFGKHVDLAPGRYTMTARVKAYTGEGGSAGAPSDYNKSIAYCDITTNSGSKTEYAFSMNYAMVPLDNEWHDVSFTFDVDTAINNAEVRFYKHGEPAAMQLDKLSIQKSTGDMLTILPGNLPRNSADALIGSHNPDGLDVTPDMITPENQGIILSNPRPSEFQTRLLPGSYDAKLHVEVLSKAASEASPMFSIQYHYTDSTGEHMTTEKRVLQVSMKPTGQTVITVPLEVSETWTNFYPVLKHLGNGTLRFHKIEIGAQTGQEVEEADEYQFAAIDTAFDENTRDDEESAIVVIPSKHDAGTAIKTAPMALKAGDYRFVVYAQLTEKATDAQQVPFTVELFDYNANNAILSTDITAQQLGTKGELKPIILPFTLENPVDLASAQVISKDLLGFRVTKLQVYSVENGGIKEIQIEDGVLENRFPYELSDDGVILDYDNLTDEQKQNPTYLGDHFFEGTTEETTLDIRPGRNRIVVRMRLLKELDDLSARLFNFDVGDPVSMTRVYDNAIRVAAVKNVGQWTDVVLECNTDQTFKNGRPAIYADKVVNGAVEIDKITYYDEAAWVALNGPLPEDPYYSWECEEMQSVTGINVGDGIVCAEGMRQDFAAVHPSYVTIPSGNWRAVVYMKVLKKTGNPDNIIATFDVQTQNSGIKFQTDITESMFEQLDTYYPIVIPFDFSEDTNCVFHISYMATGATVKFDKVTVIDNVMDVPPAVQEIPEIHQRPDGVEAHDYYEIPLVPESFKLTDESCVTFKNGVLHFDPLTNTPGKLSGLTEKFYMTNGDKVVRFYLRTPEDKGTFEFFRLTVKENGIPVGSKAFIGASFVGISDESYIVDIPITCDENNALDIEINWLGTKEITVEKIVVKENDGKADNKTHQFEMTDNGLILTKEDLADIDMIDDVVITSGNIKIFVEAAELYRWLDDGDSIELAFGDVSTQVSELLSAYTDTLDDGELLIEFNLSVVRHTEGESDAVLKDGRFTLQVEIPETVFPDAERDNLYVLSFGAKANGAKEAQQATVSPDRSYVTVTTDSFGSYRMMIYDLTDYISGNGGVNSDGDSTDTGVVFPLAVAVMFIAGFGGLMIFKKGKASKS